MSLRRLRESETRGNHLVGSEGPGHRRVVENSDDFIFDDEMLAQSIYFGFRVGEVSCPTKYCEEASSINFARSVKYGFGVLATTLKYRLRKLRIARFRLFNLAGRKLLLDYYSSSKLSGAGEDDLAVTPVRRVGEKVPR